MQLSDDFFTSVIEDGNIQLDEKLINFPMWSRFCFTFEVLITLIDLMPKSNSFLKLKALLGWLKEDKDLPINQENDFICERELELLTSKEFFMVKNFIKENNYVKNLSLDQLFIISQNYSLVLPALDIDYICDTFLGKSDIKAKCKICGKKGDRIQDFVNHKCQVKLYHPKSFVSLQRKIASTKCQHEDCTKKISINEYSCCHQSTRSDGCLMSNGNHLIYVDN